MKLSSGRLPLPHSSTRPGLAAAGGRLAALSSRGAQAQPPTVLRHAERPQDTAAADQELLRIVFTCSRKESVVRKCLDLVFALLFVTCMLQDKMAEEEPLTVVHNLL